MSDFIGIRKFCSLCKHASTNDNIIICNNKNSKFHRLRVNEVLCAPCMEAKETDRETKIETVSFD